MNRTRWLMVLGAVGVWLVASPLRAEDAPIEDKVSTAATAADHESLASYYEAQAGDAKARAERHERLARAYSRRGGKVIGKHHMQEHCEELAERSRADAEAFTAMAAAHREAAKGE